MYGELVKELGKDETSGTTSDTAKGLAESRSRRLS